MTDEPSEALCAHREAVGADRVSHLYELVRRVKDAPMMAKGEPADALATECIRTISQIIGETNALRRDVSSLQDRQAVDRSQLESLTKLTGECIVALTAVQGQEEAANDG